MSKEKIEFLNLIKRGTNEIISIKELDEKLSKKDKLIVKFGADPTAPDIHLGHSVPFEKLKIFQERGHEIVFIIGDFTAMIGDPSGRSILRTALSKDEVMKNAETYTKQVFKILDKNKTKIFYNSEWLHKLGTSGILELASKYTVARMLERDDFQKRYKSNTPISIIEFLYPLIQGYDSVVLKSDIEIGGNDQKFNLLVGRELQKDYGLEPQVILTVPLLEGLDGEKKMSKSYGNYIGISEEPKEIFGKIMSISDELMIKYYEVLTTENLEKIKKEHPKLAKENLAQKLITKYYSSEIARNAREEFNKIFKMKEIPENIEIIEIDKTKSNNSLQELLFDLKLVSSKNEARRMIEQGAVKINQEKILDIKTNIEIKDNDIIQVGKRKFAKIKIKTK
ncbi:MAG: tyrosine--tRNA ligase [Elusimicrobiota bacterium]|nr:tyrosine--tRNA ligase [Elusimicrobiota bacterium]